MPLVVLACLAYVSMALPDSVLGVAWPSMSAGFHQPLGALGLLLAFGIAASVLSSTMTGRILSRTHIGWLLSGSTVLSAVALFGYSLAPSLWAVVAATVLLGLASGAVDSGLNAHAARRFGARQIIWMHASYGFGAVIGPAAAASALSAGVHWRWAYVVIAGTQLVLACVFVPAARYWTAREDGPATTAARTDAGTRTHGQGVSDGYAVALSAVVFAVQTGIESGTGLWAYVFLTRGHGFQPGTAGLAVSGFWATMCVGRIALGPVAERLGPAAVLSGAVAGIAAGAAMMTVPGPAIVALAGMLVVGLAAAPVFPLLTLTTAARVGDDVVDRAVGYQVAASTVGGAALPSGMGLLVQHFGATALGPVVLALALVLAFGYGLLARLTTSRAAQIVQEP